MLLWECVGLIALFGGIGGVLNAQFSDNGFVLPRSEEVGGMRIYRPGFVGNIGIGVIAAIVSWGLYGPFANVEVISVGTAASSPPSAVVTVASLVGAVLTGIGGAKWLTNEVDKVALRATAAAAATKWDPAASARIATSSPFDALRVAQSLNK